MYTEQTRVKPNEETGKIGGEARFFERTGSSLYCVTGLEMLGAVERVVVLG